MSLSEEYRGSRFAVRRSRFAAKGEFANCESAILRIRESTEQRAASSEQRTLYGRLASDLSVPLINFPTRAALSSSAAVWSAVR